MNRIVQITYMNERRAGCVRQFAATAPLIEANLKGLHKRRIEATLWDGFSHDRQKIGGVGKMADGKWNWWYDKDILKAEVEVA